MLSQNQVLCHAFWLGVDVSKDTLVVYASKDGTIQTIANQDRQIQTLLRHHPGAVLVLEATGGYEMAMVTAALKRGHTLYRVNPRRVRAFMECRGVYAKTDAIDAKALAEYASMHVADLRPFVAPSADNQALAQLTRRRSELIVIRTQERNRLQAPDHGCLHKSINTVLKCLEKQIAAIDEQISRLVTKSAELTKKVDVLTSVKSVGQTTAANLLAALPELGQVSGKQITALAGLAPLPRDSGKKKGYRRTGGGRQAARGALYMAALVAARHNPTFKVFYDRLLKNGKKPLQALIAVARKLLVVLNAKLRDAALATANVAGATTPAPAISA